MFFLGCASNPTELSIAVLDFEVPAFSTQYKINDHGVFWHDFENHTICFEKLDGSKSKRFKIPSDLGGYLYRDTEKVYYLDRNNTLYLVHPQHGLRELAVVPKKDIWNADLVSSSYASIIDSLIFHDCPQRYLNVNRLRMWV